MPMVSVGTSKQNGLGPIGLFTDGKILLSSTFIVLVATQPLFKSFAVKEYTPGTFAMYVFVFEAGVWGGGPFHNIPTTAKELLKIPPEGILVVLWLTIIMLELVQVVIANKPPEAVPIDVFGGSKFW